eukprot:CAMPEP_0183704138 /NCGR_PEP_ID=MMETSP0737-20130205/1582_1 /TAXON_ID=385413 /ORGANISM="Thalassiosira miniscula, Strain CCMP1093" /LENGTH=57 /DNA_ID=CAMNT_0025930959 /DNA_START=263 /DNA_END=436 /DNA_ORIENTATION=-
MAIKVNPSPADPAIPTSVRDDILSAARKKKDTRARRLFNALDKYMTKFGEVMGSGGW